MNAKRTDEPMCHQTVSIHILTRRKVTPVNIILARGHLKSEKDKNRELKPFRQLGKTFTTILPPAGRDIVCGVMDGVTV